ncbi:glycerophosphodiester phosphodiesterase [Micrococcales bacterium 31B]|nr:glycerophosphodiester phosphodiesterase [Micrococcales bacterium 31B]
MTDTSPSLASYADSPRPRLLAHRGFALDGAENTLRAFADALAAGATIIETDVQTSSDGVPFIFHDDTLDRLTEGRGALSATAASGLHGLTVAGEPLTTLAEALAALPSACFNVDVKTAASIESTAAAIADARAARRVLLGSFEAGVARRSAERVHALTGETPLFSASLAELTPLLALQAAFAGGATLAELEPQIAEFGAGLAGCFAVQVPAEWQGQRVVTEMFVSLMHRFGLEVHVWTIDESEEMRALLALGVDGIVTNRVDRLVEVTRGA